VVVTVHKFVDFDDGFVEAALRLGSIELELAPNPDITAHDYNFYSGSTELELAPNPDKTSWMASSVCLVLLMTVLFAMPRKAHVPSSVTAAA